MNDRKTYKPSRLSVASTSVIILLAAVIVGQSSCGDNTMGTSADTTAQKMHAANPAVPTLSGNVPSEVYISNPGADTVHNRPAFDRFSWQTFIALCWPVAGGQRGVPLNPNDPNTFLQMGNSTPVVWTSYKNQWDLFGQGTKTPSPWNSWVDSVNLCPGQTLNHVFGFAKSGMQMLPGEGNESLSVPLVDQNKNYVLFEMRYNEPQYNFIVNNGLYLNSGLTKYEIAHGGAVTMPASTATSQGPILVKAAWKYLTPQDDTSRYYILNETVYNPVTKQCSKQAMGLVGLHFAQKIDSFPQWVWSSFEQVDNVPGAANAKAPYSFNNGTPNPSTGSHGFANKPPAGILYADKNMRVPVQVTRLNGIPVTPADSSTVNVNKLYQALAGNTWMRYYQLVITQWPSNPSQYKLYTQNGIYPRDCGGAFPVNNCVNTTLETYFQNRNDAAGAGGNSCMSCHYQSSNTDFSWSLQLRSH